jgi:hypothetical protein
VKTLVDRLGELTRDALDARKVVDAGARQRLQSTELLE